MPHHYHPLPINEFKLGLAATVGEDAAAELTKLYEWLSSDGRDYLAQKPNEHDIAIEPADAWIGRQVWS
jgi:hypothetical protein